MISHLVFFLQSPLMVKPMFGNTATDNGKEKTSTNEEENTITAMKASFSNICQAEVNANSAQDSDQDYQSLILPETLLNGRTSPLWVQHRRLATVEAPGTISTLVAKNSPTAHNNKNKSNGNSLVLCSTTVGCLSDQPQPEAGIMGEEEGAELSVETEERCSSYDDVVMEKGMVVISAGQGEFNTTSLYNFDSGSCLWVEDANTCSSGVPVTLRYNRKEIPSVEKNFKPQMMSSESSQTFLPAKKMRSRVNESGHSKEIQQHLKISEAHGYFAVPSGVPQDTSGQNKMIPKIFLQERKKSSLLCEITKAPFQFRQEPLMPGKTFVPNTLSFRNRECIAQQKKNKESPKSYSGIFTDQEQKQTTLCGSSYIPKNIISSLSINSSSSHTNRCISVAMKRQRITSPLCACGHRAKQQVVSNVGPNHGRGFYCCRVRWSCTGFRIQKGCEFFKWESALVNKHQRLSK